jgi:chaperone required for assembly of F1-ATPase
MFAMLLIIINHWLPMDRLMRAFDLRAAKFRSLTSEEVRKVLSTDGLAYLAEHETHSVSRPDFAVRYARQGLPELAT